MADIRDFSKGIKRRYLHASHIIVFLQRQVFDGVDFETLSSYQKFSGISYLLPANPVNASVFVQQAIVPSPCEKMILDAVEETQKIAQDNLQKNDKDSIVVQALLGSKAYSLFSVFREAMAESLRKQIPFLKDMRLYDEALEDVYDQDTAYSYLNAKIDVFKKHNGGAEWVEVRQDPNISNAVSSQLKRSGFIFSSMSSPVGEDKKVTKISPNLNL